VEQVGTPAEIVHPATAFVMSFIGPVNVLPSNSRIFQGNGFDLPTRKFSCVQDVVVEREQNSTTVPARVSRLIHLGWEIQAELTLDDGQVVTPTSPTMHELHGATTTSNRRMLSPFRYIIRFSSRWALLTIV